MPMYSFKCRVCGRKASATRSMSESDMPVLCECRRAFMDRDFKADLPHVASDRYDNPIISDSMAVSIDQIPEHRKMFPDVRITNEGQPILESYSQHEKYLEDSGFVKQPGKCRTKVSETIKLSEVMNHQ